MTGTEREDFRELRAEMRESFTKVIEKVEAVNQRVVSLETSRAVDQALVVNRRATDASNRARLAVMVGIAGVLGGFCASIIGSLITAGRI